MLFYIGILSFDLQFTLLFYKLKKKEPIMGLKNEYSMIICILQNTNVLRNHIIDVYT